MEAYPIYIFSKLGKGLDIFGNTCHPDEVLGLPKNAGEFWSKVLKIWLGLKRRDSTDQHHPIYLNSALWNNARIQYKHKNLHMKDWIAKGIYKVQDIIDDNNEIISS